MTTRTTPRKLLPLMPPLWPKLPEQTRRQLAVQIVPALRLRLLCLSDGDADADNPVLR
jgi:hypothetical protein